MNAQMKWLAVFVLFFSVHATAAAPKSFDMLLTGHTAAGPHPNDEAFIRKLIAGFVETLKVKKYVLRATPVNGGFRVCIDPRGTDGYNAIVDALQGFSVRESRWDVSLVKSCL